jgi:galactokinase
MGTHSDETILHSVDYGEKVTFTPGVSQMDSTNLHWSDYARGIYWSFHRRRHKVRGLTGVIHGDIPQRKGLSSSAALEISLVNIISHISRLKILPKAKAMLAYEAERLFCGRSCGVMDQFTSQLGKANSLLGIHCGNMMTQDILIPENVSFVVMNSMVDQSAHNTLNERRAECLDALSTLQEANWDIHSLSAITPSDLQSLPEILDENLVKRVTHVVKENQRVREGIAVMQNNNPEALGKIMIESHNSSRDLFDVSHPNLEILMNIAQQQEGTLGCRLTGAGLGGNVIILTKQKKEENIISVITQEYEYETGLKPESMICAIPGGVVIEDVTI